MALYKIGVTEAGDAGVDLSWEEKLDDVDAAVLITKCVSPDFFDATLRHKDIHDGDNVDLQLCCDCFDKLVSECNVSPIEEVDDE